MIARCLSVMWLGYPAIILSTTAAFADDPQRPSMSIERRTLEPPCPAGKATRLDLAQLASSPASFAGRCVRVKGLWTGRALYADLAGYYRAGPAVAPLPPAMQPYRIGVYARDALMKQADGFALAEAEVVGRVGVCEELLRSDGEVMVMGYCHAGGGAYLAASSIRYRPRPLVRQTSEEARRRFGNLDPAPDDWPHRQAIEQIAWRWLSAIQRGDVADFLALEGLDPADSAIDDPDSVDHAVFRARVSPFAQFRGTDVRPQFALFTVRDEGAPDQAPDPDGYAAVACFCRSDDCSGRWPISTFDAQNAASRPFVCVQIGSLAYSGRRDPPEVVTALDWRKLEEPSGRRPRR